MLQRTIIAALAAVMLLVGGTVVLMPSTPYFKAVNPLSLAPVGVPTLSDKQAVFERVWALFDEYYPNFGMKGVNWNAERSAFEPLALGAKSWTDLFEVLSNMMGTLRDAHLRFLGAPVPTMYAPVITPQVRDFAGHPMLLLAPDIPHSNLESGMFILSVNGQSAQGLVNSRLSSEGSLFGYRRYTEDANVLDTTKRGNEHVVLWKPGSGKVVSVNLPVYPMTSLVGPYEAAYRGVSLNPTPPVQWLPHQVLYLKFPTLGYSNVVLMAQFQQALVEAQQAKGIIIDFRGDLGGTMWPGVWFARHFLADAVTVTRYRVKSRTGFSPWKALKYTPLVPHLTQPIAIIINQADASAAEDDIEALAATPHARTFGSQTMGADGSPHPYPVMKGVTVLISSWQERLAGSNMPVEGFGLQPEQTVTWTYPQYMHYLSVITGQDRPSGPPLLADVKIDAAYQWLLNQQVP